MKYVIDNTISKSAYLQLYEQVKADIVKGLYPYMSKLPSKRILAEECFLSVITVEHAYTLLCEEGYIEPRERSGYYVIYREFDFFTRDNSDIKTSERKKSAVPHRVNCEFPFSVIAKAMRKVIAEYGEGLFEKTSNQGCVEIRNAISKYLARSRGIYVSPSQIVVGAGAEYLYGMIVALLGRNRVYAIEKPSYEKIELVYVSNDVFLERLPLGNDGIESEYIFNSNASVLHVSPYRSYPSGVTATASKRKEYLYWASMGDRYIVEDDFESEFTLSKKPEETIFSLSDKGNVIYMNTFSKTISSSFRVAYMVLPEKLTDVFLNNLGFYSCTVPVFEQLVITELITNGDFERHINRVRRKKRKET